MSQDEPIIEKYTLVGVDIEALEAAQAEGSDAEIEVGSWTGAPVATDRDDLDGAVLGSTYKVLRLLGEGAMGRVYEAQHTRIEGKRFAVKVLHKELMGHKDLRIRFHREAEAAALIDHPNAVGVYDVGGTEDGRPYIVSELLSGQDLSDVLQRLGKMTVPSIVRVLRQVAKALSAAHERGVVHRDVKPDNVFLTGDPARPVAKVLDFGISRLDQASNQITKLGTVIGTPSYMPPEQGRGQRVDHRADIYGLGAILYRALTGVAPHDKGNPADTLIEVLTQDVAKPTTINPAIPEDLERILLKSMARDANERYATMVEFDEALAPYEATSTTTVPGIPAGAAPPHAAPGAAGAGALLAPTVVTRSPALDAIAAQARRMPEEAPPDSHRWSVLLLAALGSAGLFLALHGAVIAMIRLGQKNATTEIGAGTMVVVAIAAACSVGSAVGTSAFHYRASWRDLDLARWLVDQLRPPVFAFVGCYGLLAALLRAAEPTLLGQAMGLAWPVWDILLLVLSLAAAAVALVVKRLGPRSPAWLRFATFAGGALVALLVVVVMVLVRGEMAP